MTTPASIAAVRADNHEEVVGAYFRAVDNRDFDTVLRLLTPDLEFSTPGGPHVHGASDYIIALKRLTPILKKEDVKRVFLDGNEACVIYDLVTDTSQGAIPSVEWMRFRDGRISSIRLIFHSLEWPKVLEELKRRTLGAHDSAH